MKKDIKYLLTNMSWDFNLHVSVLNLNTFQNRLFY